MPRAWENDLDYRSDFWVALKALLGTKLKHGTRLCRCPECPDSESGPLGKEPGHPRQAVFWKLHVN